MSPTTTARWLRSKGEGSSCSLFWTSSENQFVVPPLGGSVWRHGMGLHSTLPPKGGTTNYAFHSFRASQRVMKAPREMFVVAEDFRTDPLTFSYPAFSCRRNRNRKMQGGKIWMDDFSNCSILPRSKQNSHHLIAHKRIDARVGPAKDVGPIVGREHRGKPLHARLLE